MKFKLSAFSDEYSSDLDKQINVLKDNNFDMMEVRFVNGKNIADMTDKEVYELKKGLDDNNLKVSSVGSPLGKINLLDNFELHLEKTKRVCEIANKLNTKNIRIFSFYLPYGKQRKDCRQQVIDNIGNMLDIAKQFSVYLCHENEAKIYGETPEMCKDLLDTFNGELKCVLDMGNFVLDGYNPYEAYKKLFDYIEYFHIKDALYEGAIVPAGKGQAEIKRILGDYKQNGKKDTFITLEPHLQTFSGLNALVGKTFDNPYKYDSQEEAFISAIDCLKNII